MKSFVLLLVLVIPVIAACEGGAPTGAACPPSNAPTYTAFAQPFFQKYCLDCHSAQSTNRHDAPGDVNFDTEADIKANAADIDETAASGPKATNTSMPEKSMNVTTLPTMMEREQLGQYLACLRAP